MSSSQGNIEFSSGGDETQVQNPQEVNSIAELLRVSPEEVKKALCHRVIAVRGEVMEKRHNDSQASFGRDAFAKVRHCVHLLLTESLVNGLLSMSCL